MNPAAVVRGPKHVVTKGATPVLSPTEARKLLEHIDTGTLAGWRDRALLSVMLYSFAGGAPHAQPRHCNLAPAKRHLTDHAPATPRGPLDLMAPLRAA